MFFVVAGICGLFGPGRNSASEEIDVYHGKKQVCEKRSVLPRLEFKFFSSQTPGRFKTTGSRRPGRRVHLARQIFRLGLICKQNSHFFWGGPPRFPIDRCIWNFFVQKESFEVKEKPPQGCYIYGLIMEGARWDDDLMAIYVVPETCYVQGTRNSWTGGVIC